MAALFSTEFRTVVVAEARSWIGTPYRHQASSKGIGCDCLGLIRGVWRTLYGAEPEKAPAYTADWAEASGEETLIAAARRHMTEIAIAEASPGDVLVFRWRPHLPAKHAGILIAEKRIIHAYDVAGKVAEGNLIPQWQKRIAGAFAFPPPPEGIN